MNNITNVVLKPLESGKYMRPATLHYLQNGEERTWDILTVHDAVASIVYNISRNVLVFVKQFRPAVYLGSIPEEDRKGEINIEKYPSHLGITVELCGGMVDKQISFEEVAAEEILEECGYKVDSKRLVKVANYRSDAGRLGAVRVLYYCEVTDDMRLNKGGGIDDEIIEVVEMTVPEVRKYISKDVLSPSNFLVGMYWFLLNKANKQ